MSTQIPEQSSGLTALPQLENLPFASEGGYAPDKVREAFDAFRRHSLQLQAQIRVLQAAGRSGQAVPSGHAVRMDALHLIRAAAEFADALERDAQTASAVQFRKAEEDLRHREREIADKEVELDKYRQESERQRAELVNAAQIGRAHV